MFNRTNTQEEIPPDVREQFDKLAAKPLMLSKETPLMPKLTLPRRWRAIRRAIKKIAYLKPGTVIEFIDVGMNGRRPWYFVRVKGTVVTGWINSLLFEGV